MGGTARKAGTGSRMPTRMTACPSRFNRHLLDAAALSANEEVLDAGDPAKWYGGPPKTCHTVIVAALLRAALDGLGSAADQIDLLSEAQRFARGGVPGLQLAVEFVRRPDALEALPDEVLFAAVCEIGNVDSLGSAESTEEFMLKEISRKADEELESTEWAPVVRDLKAAGASADVSPKPS